MKIPKGGNQNP